MSLGIEQMVSRVVCGSNATEVLESVITEASVTAKFTNPDPSDKTSPKAGSASLYFEGALPPDETSMYHLEQGGVNWSVAEGGKEFADAYKQLKQFNTRGWFPDKKIKITKVTKAGSGFNVTFSIS